MPNRRYYKGRSFEYRVRGFYESHGWFVIRSAGSKGIADLIAIAPRLRQVHFIQCKVNGKLTRTEKELLLELAERYGGIPVLAKREGRKLVLLDLRDGTTDLLPAVEHNVSQDMLVPRTKQ